MDEVDIATLAQYYQRLFPCQLFYHWLDYPDPDHSHMSAFSHREFSFTIKGDVYLRYQSFKDMDDLHQALVRQAPSKIDIGAVFSAPPRNAKALQPGVFKPLSKEFVIDIDMSDYDDVRSCCRGGKICPRCWPFVLVAMRVLEAALRDDFGFQQIMWVYSGRRGVHCWVCDERARRMDDEGRKALSAYLTLVKGGAEQAKKVALSGKKMAKHPHILRSLEIIEEHFEDILLVDQDILGTPEGWNKVLALVPDEELRQKMSDRWSSKASLSSVDKWSELVDAVDKKAASGGSKKSYALGMFEREVMLQYTYPRLDENVSTHTNHLLKSPFSVHPKTGRICTPIGDIGEFDPFKVPTLAELLAELNSGMEKTSLAPYVEDFAQFVAGLEEQNKPASLDF